MPRFVILFRSPLQRIKCANEMHLTGRETLPRRQSVRHPGWQRGDHVGSQHQAGVEGAQGSRNEIVNRSGLEKRGHSTYPYSSDCLV